MIPPKTYLGMLPIATLAVGCSTGYEDVTTKCRQEGACSGVEAAPNDPKISAQLAASAALSPQERAALFKGEYLQFGFIADAFCNKTSELRQLCPASQLLVAPQAVSDELRCKTKEGELLKEGVFELRVDTPSGGRFQLMANGTNFQSNPVTSGQLEKINWTAAKDQKSYVRFVDLVSLHLKEQEGKFEGDFTPDKITHFELRIDGKTYLSKIDLQSSDRFRSLEVKLEKLQNLRDTAECAISQKFIDQTMDAAKEHVAKLTPDEKNEGLTEEQARQELPQLDFDLLNARKQKSFAQDSLGVDPNLGCWQDVTLKELEFAIDGGDEGNGRRQLDKSSKKPRKGVGNANSYTFQMSDTLRVNATNTSGSKFFKLEGRVKKSDFIGETTEIGSLRFLKIRKNGFSFDTTSHRKCGGGFLGAFASCSVRFDNFETNLTKLNRIRIYANGQLAYEKDNIDHNFRMDSLEFLDRDLRNNPAWRKLMSRSDCKVYTNPTPGTLLEQNTKPN